MTKTPRVSNEILLTAGLALMSRSGKPLTKQQGFGRAMLYSLPNEETVRVRTCNDHILIVVANGPSEKAKLNIEGTDWLLVVMPEIERTPGNVIAYLVPTQVAVEAARETHQAWLRTAPNTRGSNTTWNLWFRDEGPSKANGFAKKWEQYRLVGSGQTTQGSVSNHFEETGSVKAEVEAARERISKAAGVSPAAVKITIEFGL
jgi:hypothetical protein